MRTWNLGNNEPLTLTIAADARLSNPNYTNDHIWELSLGGSEPAALTLHTTYGLRAHWMRVFPRFKRNDICLSDPSQFFHQPILTSFYPNYLSFKFAPFKDIEISAEYWVPESGAVAGRLRLMNQGSRTESLQVEMVATLNPINQGSGMNVVHRDSATFLEGKAENLYPIFYINGITEACHSPYPGLLITLELLPGNYRQYTWALASLTTPESSFELGKKLTTCHWDGEISKLELLNASQMLEIYTGDPNWDAAFAFSQKSAFTMFIANKVQENQPVFVLSRQPDQGYSLRGDGSDYSHSWSNQSLFDLYYLVSLILPGGVSLAKTALMSLLPPIDEIGSPGNKKIIRPQPLMASIAWMIHQHTNANDWLSEIYPNLLSNIKKWFNPDNDQDQDGFPEWKHSEQTGLPESPTYDCWHSENSLGVDISTLESPSMASFLIKECHTIIKIANLINQENDLPWLEEKLDSLKRSLTSCWDRRKGIYHYRDFESHLFLSKIDLLSFRGSGSFPMNRNFKTPLRLLIHLNTQTEETIPVEITLIGQNSMGEVTEHITFSKMTWSHNRACYTTRNLFTAVARIEISGIGDKVNGQVKSVNYTLQDYSLFLPLWAEASEEEKAKKMIECQLIPHYLRPFGFSICPDTQTEESSLLDVLLPWNNLLGEALLTNGDQANAARLITRLMDGVTASLITNKAFRDRYNSINGQPSGEKNSFPGLAPIGLFLKTLGIQLFTPTRIILNGLNPFPWPVTIKHKGVILTCHAQDSVISFPNGQTITVTGEGPHNILVT